MPPEEPVEELLGLCRLLNRLANPVRRGEITAEQFWLLRQLRRGGSQTVGDIARALGVTQSSATIACQRLERQGLVRRYRGSADERVVSVALTPTGEEQWAEWRARRRTLLREMLSSLEPEEQRELRRLLERVLPEGGGANEPAHD